MDDKIDKRLDELSGKLLRNFSRETPSFGFTTRVMSKIETLADSQVVKYKPLISKRIWAVLCVFVLGAFSYLIFGDVQTESSWLSLEQMNWVPNFDSLNLPDFQISNVVLYGVLGFTFFMGIQIFMLKHHFNKRFATD